MRLKNQTELLQMCYEKNIKIAELEKENESLENVKNIYIGDLLKAKKYIRELARAVEHSYSVLNWQRPPIKIEAENFLKEDEK